MSAKGSIKRDANGTYSFVVDLGRKMDGKRHQARRRGFATKKVADEALTALKEAHRRGEIIQNSDQPLSEFLDYWLGMAKDGGKVKLKAWERYEQMVRVNICPALGHIPLKYLKTEQIDIAYINMMKGEPEADARGLAPKTIRNIHGVLKQALDRAVTWQHLNFNPASVATLPEREEIEMQILDRDQQVQIINAAQGTLMFPVMMLALSTGMRRGELSALKWSNVNLEEGWIDVKKAVSETKGSVREIKEVKTKAGKRKITLPPFIVDFLRQHYANESEKRLRLGLGRPNDVFVLTTEIAEMRTPNSITNFFDKLRKGVMKDDPTFPYVRFHDMRHTHISQLLSDGWPITEVCKRAGHANAFITLSIYAHAMPKADDELVKMFGAQFEAAMEQAENGSQ